MISQKLGNLASHFFLKYQNDSLAGVYLAKYPDGQEPKIWGDEFRKMITPIQGHPDILWVNRSETENEYKVDSLAIKEFLNFLNYRPHQLKTKFIFLADAHLISTAVCNKLLKVLEELPPYFCLFLFSPRGETLLPTIESRAIKINLPVDLAEKDAENLPIGEFQSLPELIQFLKSSANELLTEKKFIEKSIDQTLKNPSFLACEAELENLKQHFHSDAFNNAKISRLAPFFK